MCSGKFLFSGGGGVSGLFDYIKVLGSATGLDLFKQASNRVGAGWVVFRL